MTTETAIRTPAEVQADIVTLKNQIANASDLIFAKEQESTDYRAMLADATRGTENVVELAVLREKRRALEIALEAAKEDLKRAEQNVVRENTIAARENLKQQLVVRHKLAEIAIDAINQAAVAVKNIQAMDAGIVQDSKLRLNQHALTESGYLVITGIEALGDGGQMLKQWAEKAFAYGLNHSNGYGHDFAGQVEEIGANVLRQWDIANSTSKLKIIDHDPIQGGEQSVAGAVAVDFSSVERFDEDPTEEDLAAIAELPPEKAARAMRAFSNTRWARENGMRFPPANADPI